MITKKQLQEQYKLSHNTVTETLKACGLDTSKREYSEDQIETLFIPARKMLDEGKTYDDVKAKFLHLNTAQPPNAPAAAEGVQVETTQFAEQITAEVQADAKFIIYQAIRKTIQYLPEMTYEAFNELEQINEIRLVYQRYRQRVISELPSSPPISPSISSASLPSSKDDNSAED